MTSDVTSPALTRAGRLATITLRNPATINAIGPEEITALTAMFDAAVRDPAVTTIAIRGEGARGFCAGGDIKRVRSMIVAGDLDGLAAFWADEYRLDHLFATCPKPIVSLAHGLTLGGGMGLASHASHRVVTESTRLGMPEVLIGLSPDAGGLWLYGRAPGSTGVFAALTAAQLSAGDALYMGLADHFVPDDRVEELLDDLQQVPADAALGCFDTRPPSWIADRREDIDRMFGRPTISDIAAVARDGRGYPADLVEVANTMLADASPTALSLTFEAVHRAAAMTSLAECLEQDLRVGQHCARYPDLAEGIRARVVDKDRSPRWTPPSLAEVSPGDVAGFFAPIGTPLRIVNW